MFFLLQCIVLACIATSLTKEMDRSKRHIAFWKNLITSYLFQPDATTQDFTPILGAPAVIDGNKENFKLYRIPGFNNILVKAVPKVKTNLTNEDNITTTTTPPSELEKEKEPTVAILETYLGTKTMNDTVKALQGVRDMLQSGVLDAQSGAAEERPKETVFVIPPMMPPEVPVAPFLSHIAPMSVVQNFVLPDLKPLSVQRILPVPITPSAQYSLKEVKGDGSVTSVSSPDVIVTEMYKPPPLLVNRFQHMVRMPFAPLPTLPSLPSIPNYLVPRLMNPVNVVDMPIQPLVNTPSIFVESSNVAVKGYPYPYKPCCKSAVAMPAKPSYLIEKTNSALRPPMLVKDTVVVPRPPSIMINRLEKITGGKLFGQRPIITASSFVYPSRESINEQSKFINVRPLSAAWISPVPLKTGNVSGHSYKVVNKDGSVTTFSKLSDYVDDLGYNVNMENDDGYYQTDDGRIFYSRLVKDPSLVMSKDIQDELAKKHRKNQYTVTNVEEYKNLLNHDDVQVTYGTDQDNDPFLSYRVPSGSYSFRQVKDLSKLKEDNLPPLKSGGMKETSDNLTTTEKGIVLPSGPSRYSFKQIHDDGSITEYVAYDSTNSNVDVLQNVQDAKENSKGQASIPGAVTLKEPTFVFKQVNNNNSQPVVGQVEGTPSRLDDKDKVNAPAHVRSDSEVHSVPPSVAATVPLPMGLSSTVPKDFIYMPPKADVPFISTHKVGNERLMENYPSKIINSRAILKPSKSSSNDNIPIFGNTNPIVVPDENEEEDASSSRGDVPDAFS